MKIFVQSLDEQGTPKMGRPSTWHLIDKPTKNEDGSITFTYLNAVYRMEPVNVGSWEYGNSKYRIRILG